MEEPVPDHYDGFEDLWGAVRVATEQDIARTKGAPESLKARAIKLARVLDALGPVDPGIASVARQHSLCMTELEKYARPAEKSGVDELRERRRRRREHLAQPGADVFDDPDTAAGAEA